MPQDYDFVRDMITPEEAQTKQATLGNLLQEQKLRQQQTQEAQLRAQQIALENQEKQQMQHGVGVWTDKFYQNKGDFAKTLADPDVQQIHPTLYGKIADQYQQIRERAAIASKNELELGSKQHEQLGGMLESMLQLPDEKRFQQWPQLRQDAIQRGYVKPEEIPEADPGRQWLETHRYYGMGQEKVMKAELDRRKADDEAKAAAAKLPGEQALSQSHVLDLTGRVAGATLGALAPTPAAGTAPAAPAQPPVNGQPAGTNVSGSKLNAYTGPETAPGMLERGNINLKNRPATNNPDGTSSTVRTTTIEEDGKTILIPTVVNGKIVSDDDAIKHYHDTGEHMGIFKTEKDADEYDKQLHNEMGWNGAPGSAQAAWQASAGANRTWTRDQLKPVPGAERGGFTGQSDLMQAPDGSIVTIRRGSNTSEPGQSTQIASTSGQRSPEWTKEKQDAWDQMRKLVPAGALPYLPPEWSPAAQRTAQRLGLSAEQQVVNDRERRTARATGAPKTPDEFIAASTDPTLTPEERQRWKDALAESEKYHGRVTAAGSAVQNRSDEKEFDKWSTKHEELQQKEREQWKLVGEYGDALNAKTDEDVVDPATKKTVSMDAAHRAYFQKQYESTRASAEQFKKQAAGIRERFKWGEFAPKQGEAATSQNAAPKATAAPGRAAASSVPVPPITALKEGVARRFTGRAGLWTLKAGQPVNLEQ